MQKQQNLDKKRKEQYEVWKRFNLPYLKRTLKAWDFYPLHKSVFLHAYPCEKQVEFLRQFLGVGRFVRIFNISKMF